MTKRNARSGSGRSGSRRSEPRAEAQQEETPRRGLLDSIFAPRAAASTSMPRIRSSLARGVTVVAGTGVFWAVRRRRTGEETEAASPTGTSV